jgi:hypothetical protein
LKIMMSGWWVPPRYGWLKITTSPGSSAWVRRSVLAARLSVPWCEGTWSAWATSWPVGSNSAVEQSISSRIRVEYAVRMSVVPISRTAATR